MLNHYAMSVHTIRSCETLSCHVILYSSHVIVTCYFIIGLFQTQVSVSTSLSVVLTTSPPTPPLPSTLVGGQSSPTCDVPSPGDGLLCSSSAAVWCLVGPFRSQWLLLVVEWSSYFTRLSLAEPRSNWSPLLRDCAHCSVLFCSCPS